MAIPPSDKTFSVSELNGIARGILESQLHDVWVEGELGNVARPGSGHLYFTLKDARAQIRCAMFRNRGRFLRFEPDTGMRVRVNGKVSLYEARGDYQLIVERMEPAGEGALQQAFERLKRKLFEARLFDEALKKPLPEWPRRIGIITSPTGAAIRDILQILRRRFALMEVIIYPVQVQGEESAAQIVTAIEKANQRNEVDLLIVTRGGGSLEDLWSFNDERVALAIHHSALPVVSAVGHEIDVTIADYVADARAPTPSAAAELISPEAETLYRHLDGISARLAATMEATLDASKEQLQAFRQRLRRASPTATLQQQMLRLDELTQRLAHASRGRLDTARFRLDALRRNLLAHEPRPAIALGRERLQSLRRRLTGAMHDRLEQTRQRLAVCENALNHLGPEAVLERGYAIVSDADTGQVITSAATAREGERIDIQFRDGVRRGEIRD